MNDDDVSDSDSSSSDENEYGGMIHFEHFVKFWEQNKPRGHIGGVPGRVSKGRSLFGDYSKLSGQNFVEYWFDREMEKSNPKWLNMFRLPKVLCEQLHYDLKQDLGPGRNSNHTAVTAGECILIALHFLGSRSGGLERIREMCGRSPATIMNCVNKFCEAVIKTYKQKYVWLPEKDECLKIARTIEKEKRMPLCLGGKRKLWVRMLVFPNDRRVKQFPLPRYKALMANTLQCMLVKKTTILLNATKAIVAFRL